MHLSLITSSPDFAFSFRIDNSVRYLYPSVAVIAFAISAIDYPLYILVSRFYRWSKTSASDIILICLILGISGMYLSLTRGLLNVNSNVFNFISSHNKFSRDPDRRFTGSSKDRLSFLSCPNWKLWCFCRPWLLFIDVNGVVGLDYINE